MRLRVAPGPPSSRTCAPTHPPTQHPKPTFAFRPRPRPHLPQVLRLPGVLGLHQLQLFLQTDPRNVRSPGRPGLPRKPPLYPPPPLREPPRPQVIMAPPAPPLGSWGPHPNNLQRHQLSPQSLICALLTQLFPSVVEELEMGFMKVEFAGLRGEGNVLRGGDRAPKGGRGRQWDFLGEARDRGRLLNVPDSTALPTAPEAADYVAPAEGVEEAAWASRRPQPRGRPYPPRAPPPPSPSIPPHPGPGPHQVLVAPLRGFQQPASSLRVLPRRLARLPAQGPRQLALLPLQAAEGKLR